MPEFTDGEFMILLRLWAEAYLRIKKIGEMLLKKQPLQKKLKTKMGLGRVEVNMVKRDKNGKIVHRQKIRSTGEGEILEHKRWDKEKNNGIS